MRTIADIRLENLELLVKEAGTLDAVAEKADTTSVYLSQLRTRAIDIKTGHPREMGTRIARRLDDAYGKPRGWMDESHYTEAGRTAPVEARQETLQMVALNSRELDAIVSLRALSHKQREGFISTLIQAAEDARQFAAEVIAREVSKAPAPERLAASAHTG